MAALLRSNAEVIIHLKTNGTDHSKKGTQSKLVVRAKQLEDLCKSCFSTPPLAVCWFHAASTNCMFQGTGQHTDSGLHSGARKLQAKHTQQLSERSSFKLAVAKQAGGVKGK